MSGAAATGKAGRRAIAWLGRAVATRWGAVRWSRGRGRARAMRLRLVPARGLSTSGSPTEIETAAWAVEHLRGCRIGSAAGGIAEL